MKKIIYMDQKFWLCLTKANSYNKDTKYVSLLNKMRNKKDKFIAPISAINFFELAKIQDKDYLEEIEKVVNEFSDKKCFLPWFDIIKYDVINAAYDFWKIGTPPYNMRREGLAEQRFLLGKFTVDYSAWINNYPDRAQIAIAQSEERMEKMSVFEWLNGLDKSKYEAEDAKWSLEIFSKRAHYNKSQFNEKDFFYKEFPDLRRMTACYFIEELLKIWRDYKVEEKNLYDFLSYENLIKVPSIRYLLSWEAKEFSDKMRKIEGNDFYDSQHIIAALIVGVDCFATEKHAGHIIKQIDPNTKVFVDPEEMEKYIDSL